LAVLLLVTVAVALAGVGVLNLSQNGDGTTKPSTPTKTSPNSDSDNQTTSPSEGQSPVAAGTYNDLSYGSDTKQKFDIYIPETTATRLPLIILVHGGAWSSGDKNDVSAVANFIASQDFVVINTNYRLLPDFSYPAPLQDFQMLLQWVNQNSEQYRIDVTRVGMSGHSAGGHLIALYALTQNKNYIAGGNVLPKVYAVAPLAGGFTLEGIDTTSDKRENTIIAWLKTANPQSLGLPIDQVDSSDTATFLLLHGEKDVNSPPQQSSLFYQALVDGGVEAEIKIYPGRTHLTLVSGIPDNDEVARDLISFFNEKLK